MVLEQSPEFPDFDLAELPDLPELEGEISATASQDSELDQLLGLSSGFEQEFGSGSSQFSSDLSGDGSLDDLMNELNSDPAFSNTGGFESLGLPESKTDVKIEQDEFASLLDDIAAESEQPDLSQSQTLELDPFSVDFAPSQAPIPDLEEAADDLMEDFATADTIQILETIAGPSTEAFPIEPGDQVNDLDDLESFLSAELPSTELGDVPDEPDPFGQITPEFSDPFAIQQSSVPSSSAFNYMDLEPEVSGEMGEFEVSVTPSQPGEDLPESVAELSPDLSLDSGAGFAADLEEVSTTPDVPIPVDFAEPNEPSNLGPSEHITEIPSQLSEDLPESVAELSPDLSLDSGAGFAPDLEEVSTSLSESVSEIEELPTSEPGVEDAADELDMFEAELESSPIAGFTEILTTTQPDPELPSDYTQIITSSVPEELPSDYTQIADSSQPAEVPDQKPTLDQAIASEPQFAEAVGEGNPFGKFILPGIIALIVAIGGIFALSPKKSDTPPPQNTQQGR